ncbi:MAG: type II secretion system protein [Syntrophotaleaceae bacterium]
MPKSHRLPGNERGAALMILLVMVMIMGLSAGIAGTTWTNVMQRAREEEMLFRGDQYRRAIGSYYSAGTTAGNYPLQVEELLKDPRYPGTVRHLRRLYPDPITGDAWELVKDSAGRILGVRGASGDKPLKTKDFPEEYEQFENAKTYRDWVFLFEPQDRSAAPAGAEAS